jgi:uncharacterized membrane protein YhaH (DUF805 family)
MNWYFIVLTKYATFSGRARRKEHWYFALFSTIIVGILGAADVATGGMGLFSGIYSLAILIPSLAVGVRRLHDTNRSGWWLLIVLVPLIGVIVLLIFMLQGGTQGENRYGGDPKQAEA